MQPGASNVVILETVLETILRNFATQWAKHRIVTFWTVRFCGEDGGTTVAVNRHVVFDLLKPIVGRQ